MPHFITIIKYELINVKYILAFYCRIVAVSVMRSLSTVFGYI
jgi:hypothetical protein